MQELNFTIELNGQGLSNRTEAEMFDEAERRLRNLARGHEDMTGAAVNARQPAVTTTPFIYDVTVVVYARPNHVVASEKEADPIMALKNALSAIERQIREKRRKLRNRWEQPGNLPVEQEILQVVAAEGRESLAGQE